MDDEGETFVTGGEAPPPEFASRVPAATWVGVAVIGVALFLLGIWLPAWRGVVGAGTLNLVVAAAGGVLFLVGVTFAWQGYVRTRPTPAEVMPGVEVFSPPARARIQTADTTPDEEPR
jgi:hypothetical protein